MPDMKNRNMQLPPVIDILHAVFILVVAGACVYAGVEFIAANQLVLGVCMYAIAIAMCVCVWSFLTGGRFS